MKNFVTQKSLVYLFVSILVLFIQCTKEESLYNQIIKDKYIEIAVFNPAVKSPIDNQYITAGSEIGVSLLAENYMLYDGRTICNVNYKSTNRFDGSLLWHAFDPILLSSSRGVASVIFPYRSDIDPAALNLDYKDEVDWLYANASGLSESNYKVNFTLKHAMSGLRLLFVRGNLKGSGNVSNIAVEGSNIALCGVLNTFNGVYSFDSGSGNKILFTDDFVVSSTPYKIETLFVPNGINSNATLSVTVDGIDYDVSLSPFLSTAGNVYEFTITIDEKSVSVQSILDGNMSYNELNQPVLKVGSYNVTLAGDLSNIAIAHSEGTNSAVINAVLLNQGLNQLPACPSMSGNAIVSHAFNSDRTMRTISLTNITSDITLTFDGVATQLPVSSVTANGAYYLTADNYGSDKWEYGATDVFVVGKSRRYVVEPTNAGSSTVAWGGWPSNKSCADYSKADGSNSSITLSTSADPSSWTGGAISEFAGYTNSGYITSIEVGKALVNFRNSSGNNSWFIPSCGEMALLYLYKTKVNEVLGKLGGVALEDAEYWTSTERDGRSAWYINLSSGKVDNTGKLNKKKRRYLREI